MSSPPLVALIGLLLAGSAGSIAVRSGVPARLPQAHLARTPLVVLHAAEGFEGLITQFAPPKELPNVRSSVSRLAAQLSDAIEAQDFALAAMLRDDLAEMRSKDPALMASRLRKEMADHAKRERYDDAARCRDELRVLRRFLPQYSLAGLWKGNYPNHGSELVRIRYEGDQLYATKVTGDEHVPAGEVTFRADLAAPFDAEEAELIPVGGEGEDALGVKVEVVSLSADGGQEQREVEQFRGEGRVAARGFQHAHYVPGQLFLMDDGVVGFLWLPIGTFVVFTRVPEAEEREAQVNARAERALKGGRSVALEIDASGVVWSSEDDE